MAWGHVAFRPAAHKLAAATTAVWKSGGSSHRKENDSTWRRRRKNKPLPTKTKRNDDDCVNTDRERERERDSFIVGHRMNHVPMARRLIHRPWITVSAFNYPPPNNCQGPEGGRPLNARCLSSIKLIWLINAHMIFHCWLTSLPLVLIWFLLSSEMALHTQTHTDTNRQTLQWSGKKRWSTTMKNAIKIIVKEKKRQNPTPVAIDGENEEKRLLTDTASVICLFEWRNDERSVRRRSRPFTVSRFLIQ